MAFTSRRTAARLDARRARETGISPGSQSIRRIRITLWSCALGDVFGDSTDRGVYVTFDGGKTWTKSLYAGVRSGASDIAINIRDPNIVYAGIWEFRRQPWTFTSGGNDDGLYKPSDGGTPHFRNLTGGGFPAANGTHRSRNRAERSQARLRVDRGKGRHLWRTDDNGAPWTMMSRRYARGSAAVLLFSHRGRSAKSKSRLCRLRNAGRSIDGGKKFKEIAKRRARRLPCDLDRAERPESNHDGEDGGSG